MSFKASLRRFRPRVESCEPRDVPAAGLAVAAGGVIAPSHHFEARVTPAALTSYSMVVIRNSVNHTVDFTLNISLGSGQAPPKQNYTVGANGGTRVF